MKFTIILGILLAFEGQVLAFSGCLAGEGKVIEESRSYKDIDRIKMMASVDLIVAKSADSKIEIKGPKDLVENLRIEEKDGELRFAQDKCVSDNDALTLKLFVSKLSEIAVMGASDIKVVDSFDSDKLNIEIAGSGDVTGTFKAGSLGVDIKGAGDVKLTGSADEFTIDIKGSGDITSQELVAKKVDVSIKGSGDVKVNAVDTLNVKILGSGDVHYSGRPKIDVQKLGSGSVKAL